MKFGSKLFIGESNSSKELAAIVNKRCTCFSKCGCSRGKDRFQANTHPSCEGQDHYRVYTLSKLFSSLTASILLDILIALILRLSIFNTPPSSFAWCLRRVLRVSLGLSRTDSKLVASQKVDLQPSSSRITLLLLESFTKL